MGVACSIKSMVYASNNSDPLILVNSCLSWGPRRDLGLVNHLRYTVGYCLMLVLAPLFLNSNKQASNF